MARKVSWGGEVIFATSDLFLHPTITTWMCGCPLRCPFCHNWRIAEGQECKVADINEIVDAIKKVENDIKEVGLRFDYVHLTGGDPGVWPYLVPALAKHWPISLYTTFIDIVKENLEASSHFAFDLKVPYGPLTGLKRERWGDAAKEFIEGVKYVVESGKPFELRVPVAKRLTNDALEFEGTKALLALLAKGNVEVVVVHPLLSGKLGIEARMPNWPYLNPTKEEVMRVKEVLETYFKRVEVREDMLKALE